MRCFALLIIWCDAMLWRVQIVVEADGSRVDGGTDMESICEGLRVVAISEGDGEDIAAAEAARVQEKSDEEFARMLQV